MISSAECLGPANDAACHKTGRKFRLRFAGIRPGFDPALKLGGSFEGLLQLLNRRLQLSQLCCLSAIRGFLLPGFARGGEKIAKAIGRLGPLTLLVARGNRGVCKMKNVQVNVGTIGPGGPGRLAEQRREVPGRLFKERQPLAFVSDEQFGCFPSNVPVGFPLCERARKQRLARVDHLGS